jgi:hypothetical protein
VKTLAATPAATLAVAPVAAPVVDLVDIADSPAQRRSIVRATQPGSPSMTHREP